MPQNTNPLSRKIKRALLSVSDKTGLVALAEKLHQAGIELISTGGSAKILQEAGLPVTNVSQITNFPEIMDGRVKTLHPSIHGGLLAVRDNEDHLKAMKLHNFKEIDLLIVNLYPFVETCAKGASDQEIIENIDIGGPAMIRAGAKNHAYVAVVTNPADYPLLCETLATNSGCLSLSFRRELAQKAFHYTAAYDAAISAWFNSSASLNSDMLPQHFHIEGQLHAPLRYGENPHQKAAFYTNGEERCGVATAKIIQNKQLSYNNIADADAALELVSEFDPAQSSCVAIIKHMNPCGVATGGSLLEAYQKALACDSVSAFGGIVACNQTLDAACAEAMSKIFTEVIIAPHITDEAQEILSKKKNLRLVRTGGLPKPQHHSWMVKSVAGGFLVQSRDTMRIEDMHLKCVTQRRPTEEELSDLKFAYRVAKHVKSNAIVYAKHSATIGIGAGQMSRVDSARLAADKAHVREEIQHLPVGSLTKNCVAASDAFFPFADAVLTIAKLGATAIIQPGGSIRDEEIIKAADEVGLAMVLTGIRHFKH